MEARCSHMFSPSVVFARIRSSGRCFRGSHRARFNRERSASSDTRQSVRNTMIASLTESAPNPARKSATVGFILYAAYEPLAWIVDH